MISERTEQYRTGAGASDRLDQIVAEFRVITVEDYCVWPSPGDRIAGRLVVPWELRLKTGNLDHQTQQRGDNFFARENQHIAQLFPTVKDRL